MDLGDKLENGMESMGQIQLNGRTEESQRSISSKYGSKRFFILAAIVAGVAACASIIYFVYFGRPEQRVLALVNGEKITVGDFNREIQKIESPQKEILKENPSELLETIILKLLLLQEAKREGISIPPKTYRDEVPPEEAAIAQFLKKKFGSPPAVTRKEVEAFYGKFKEQMAGKKIDQVAPIIEQMIQQKKQREAIESFFEELRKKARIEVREDRLQKIATKPPDSNTDEEFRKALQSGKPALVDFGANTCVPCRMLRPILKEIDKEYSGKVKVLVIDVYKYQQLARENRVVVIPTLIFFDSQGKEVFRHVGLMEKEKIVSKLKEIGIVS